MHRILLSAGMILVAVATVAGGTAAFYSDSETSTGNTFSAGAIDLSLANDSYVTNQQGELVKRDDTSWELTNDAEGELFFDFADLKPGDFGEDTISLNPDSNDAYVCMASRLTERAENGLKEPEEDAGDTADEGELQDALQFAVWADDGDNVFEDDERLLNLGDNGDEIVTLEELASEGKQALADSKYSVFTDDNGGEPIPGGQTQHIGKAWCMGDLDANPVDQDNEGFDGPVSRGATGFTCDGSAAGNETQSDIVKGDVQFYAVQARNNDDFTCSDDFSPDWPSSKPEANTVTDSGWSPVDTDEENGGASKEWFAKARNNNENYELSVGIDDQSNNKDTAETTWSGGQQENFTLSYDSSSGEAKFAVDGRPTTTFNVGTTEDFSRIGVNVKAPSDDTTEVNGLSLDVAQSLSTDSVSATGGTEHLLISGINLSNQNWKLSGSFSFSAVGGSSQENPAVQFSID